MIIKMHLDSKERLGCKDPDALNYNANVTTDNGSCIFKLGCKDSTACNYDSSASKDSGVVFIHHQVRHVITDIQQFQLIMCLSFQV